LNLVVKYILIVINNNKYKVLENRYTRVIFTELFTLQNRYHMLFRKKILF